jgi:hypothetical protein
MECDSMLSSLKCSFNFVLDVGDSINCASVACDLGVEGMGDRIKCSEVNSVFFGLKSLFVLADFLLVN